MAKTNEELEAFDLKIESQIQEINAELKVMTASITRLSESLVAITDLMREQIHLTGELTHLRKDFESHERDSEKTLMRIDKDLDALHIKHRACEERLHLLEIELHDNTNARKIGQWFAGLVIATLMTFVFWKLK